MVCGEAVPYFFVLQNEDHFAYTGISVRLFSDFSYVEELPGDREYELLPGEKYTLRPGWCADIGGSMRWGSGM